MTEQLPVSLRILEAYTRDVGRGVARIDYDSMDELHVSTGDILQIKGTRISVAKCLPLYPSDEGKGIIRIDGLVRKNLGSDLACTVEVIKIKAVAANLVTVTPLEAIPPIDERYLTDCMESVPILKEDKLVVPYFGGRLNFQIIEIDPKDVPAICSSKTRFKIVEDKERFEKYSTIGKSFTTEEDRLLKELKELVSLPYDETTGDQILAISQSIEKLHKVKKIALNLINDFLNEEKIETKETPKSQDDQKENEK